LNNHLPNPGDEDSVDFAMRMPNFTNSGNQGSGSGWVLPLAAAVNCDFNNNPVTKVMGWEQYQATTADRGYICYNATGLGSDLTCTILDGTQYRFSISGASSAKLVVQVVQP
jgi:hypothetical protein